VDSDLIRSAQRGDAGAYEQLVARHQEPMFRLAYLMCGDADDAEDIAQDALIAAYRALPRFDAERPLRPWLLKITANTARNRRRSLGRYLNALRRWALDAVVEADAEAQAAGTLESAALLAAVRRLSEPDQAVIYLRYYLDLSVDEAAQALDVEPGTVKSRLSRALGRLRDSVLREQPLWIEGGEW
jgi:RNA polymerase sigma-70 factor, ECF subfamily